MCKILGSKEGALWEMWKWRIEYMGLGRSRLHLSQFNTYVEVRLLCLMCLVFSSLRPSGRSIMANLALSARACDPKKKLGYQDFRMRRNGLNQMELPARAFLQELYEQDRPEKVNDYLNVILFEINLIFTYLTVKTAQLTLV